MRRGSGAEFPAAGRAGSRCGIPAEGVRTDHALASGAEISPLLRFDDRQGDRAWRDARRGARAARARARQHGRARASRPTRPSSPRCCAMRNSPRTAPPRIFSAAGSRRIEPADAGCRDARHRGRAARRECRLRRMEFLEQQSERAMRVTIRRERRGAARTSVTASAPRSVARRSSLRVLSIDAAHAPHRDRAAIEENITFAIEGERDPSRPRRPELQPRRHHPRAARAPRVGRKRRPPDRADERPRGRGQRQGRRHRRGRPARWSCSKR